jgi:hypothetical protein
MSLKSRPLEATPDATITSLAPDLKDLIAYWRSSCATESFSLEFTSGMKRNVLFDPWIATASTPFKSRYSCMSNTVINFSNPDSLNHRSPSTSFLFSLNMITGGGVFCRHSRRYTILASCLTYSTTCSTSRFAAPARPTFTRTGLISDC